LVNLDSSDVIQKIFFPVLLTLALVGETTAAENSCQKFFVSAPDGYVNIRSSAAIKLNNIVATLPTGSSIELSQRRQRWLKIKSPLSGWLVGNQISRISCDAGTDLLLKTGIPAIGKLAKQAELGDSKAAEALLKMSPHVDGVVAEAHGEAIAGWAENNPRFLVSLLDRQTPAIRRAALSSLDFGLGAVTNSQRRKFETFLQQLPRSNPTLKDWRARDPVYS
jgi:hypothetical protein